MTRPCPKCGTGDAYPLRTRPGFFTCRNQRCKRQFSATSETIMADHKRPLESYAAIVRALVEGRRSALAIAKECGVRSNKIYALLQKIRIAMAV